MKVQYLVDFAGPRVDIRTGDIREVEKAEAQRLIDAGYATPHIEAVDEVEYASVETTARESRPQKRKRQHVGS